MFITYDENGKLLSKQSSTSTEFTPVGNFIELDDINQYIDLKEWRIDTSSKQLIELPPKPKEGYEFDYVTLEWKPNIELLKGLAYNTREKLLQRSDWTDTVSAQTRLSNYAEWQVYRQALRDITGQTGYPLDIVWPDPPV